MSGSEDIAAFLRARLDEDEAAARAATEAAGQWFEPGPGAGEWSVRNNRAIVECPTGVIAFDEGCPTDAQAEHIARHDPARALREVTADRHILARFADYRQEAEAQRAARGAVSNGVWTGYLKLREVVRLRAAVFSDHPDYRKEWAP